MKTKDFKSVKEARAAAEHQLKFYREMMATKDANESVSSQYIKEKVAEDMQPFYEAFNQGYKMSERESKKKLFIVDTISTFRQRYVIEAESLEHAYDEVTMRDSGSEDDDFEEFSQKWLGETIIDGREIKMKHFNKMLEEDKECCGWMGEKLIRKINYDR
jgi:hypothetical protein